MKKLFLSNKDMRDKATFMQKSSLSIPFLIFASIFLIVLHPYTVYGKPGILAVIVFCIYALKENGIDRTFFVDLIAPTILLLLIATFGAMSSVMNGIPQINHPLAVVSLLAMILAAKGIFLYCKKKGLSIDDFLLIVLLVVILNSIVVLLELQFDPLRQFIEGYLDQLTEGSINYAEGYRLRGIASSGGAALSISVPAALIIALYLFDKGRLNVISLLILIAIFLASVIAIGRSGIVLLMIPTIAYVILLLSKKNGLRSIVKALFFLSFLATFIVPIFYQFISDFFSEMFGDAFIKYAFGFLLDGRDGIQEEGTVGIVAEFLAVLPFDFPYALTGYGFYGGSDFYPWTDSGYSRMFLSVGFLFGFLFYILLYRMYFLPLGENKFLIGSLIVLLAVAEAKEPLLYSGVASRIFILVLVYCYCEKKSAKKLKGFQEFDRTITQAAGLVGR